MGAHPAHVEQSGWSLMAIDQQVSPNTDASPDPKVENRPTVAGKPFAWAHGGIRIFILILIGLLAMRSTRRLISLAARREKVRSSIRRGSAPSTMRWATRCARVLVLPEPAPAIMRSGDGLSTPCSTARRCSGLSVVRYGAVMKGAVANHQSTSKHGFSSSCNKAAVSWLSAGLIVQPARFGCRIFGSAAA